jgi:hypothetical protein
VTADGAVGIGANQEAITHFQHAWDPMTVEHGAVSHQQRDAIRFKLACLHFVAGQR